MLPTIDLHVHSTYSDGLLTPVELVQLAARHGIEVLAIADHDSVDGIDEAQQEGKAIGVTVIPAVELSVEFGQYHDVHLLGYLIDHSERNFLDILGEFRTRRDARGRMIIDRINELLVSEQRPCLSYAELQQATEGAFGRPHIARQLVALGAALNMQDAFTKYLGPCNVPKQYFPMHEAIGEIRRIGGLSVLAHPVSISGDHGVLRPVIDELASMGLDGIEVFNNMSTGEDSNFLEEMAGSLGLVATGGSDFHGGEDGIRLGEIRSGRHPNQSHLEKLLERRNRLFS